MFVLNLKLNSNIIMKISLIVFLVLVLIIVGISIHKIFFNTSIGNSNCIDPSNNFTLSTSNYTNVLKAVHDNLEDHIGEQITFSGYIYKVYDFNDNQFVLARDMIIDSNNQTLVVGFLCESDKTPNFSPGTWVSVNGTITKGNYHGEIPILKINEIKKIEKPSDEYVYPPDGGYVQTSTIL